ncbi:MAG: DHH family phosphoesterase [Planctomycetota bacterium]
MTTPLVRKPIDYDRVANFFRERDHFLLTGHVRADGDCLGSEVALYHLLVSLGKTVNIVNPDPIAPRYKFLLQHTPISHFQAYSDGSKRGGLPKFNVACLLDCAVLERTGEVGEAIRNHSAEICIIDHHQPGGGAAFDLEFVDSAAPASGVLVFRLAKKLGVELPKAALEAVFVSLTTDTGWFKYSNSDRECFQAAADLVALGVDPSVVYGKLYQNFPPEYPIGIGATLRSLRYEAGGRLAIVSVKNDEMKRAGAELAETDDVLDILRSVGTVDVVLLFRESQPGRVKCSARSKGAVDVNALMRQFGGGGHTRAAGADLPGPYEITVERVVSAAVHALSAV